MPLPSVTVHNTSVIPRGNSTGALFEIVSVPHPTALGEPNSIFVAIQVPASTSVIKDSGAIIEVLTGSPPSNIQPFSFKSL